MFLSPNKRTEILRAVKKGSSAEFVGKLIRIGPVAGPSTERVNRAAHRWTDLRVRGRNAYLAGLSAQVDREKHGGGQRR